MKKGFTLVEIIIVIALCTTISIGVTLGVININNKQNNNKLNDMSEDIYTAVHLLVETNEEIKSQLYNSKNGVVIPLKKLETEGLVDFNGINIEGQQVLTMLASETESEKCNGSLYDIGTWTVNQDDVIYICGDAKGSDGGIREIKKELILDSFLSNKYVASGASPNNYVLFDVDTDDSEGAYFPLEDQDLWRIFSIDVDGTIKLVYNRPVPSNNNVFVLSSCRSGYCKVKSGLRLIEATITDETDLVYYKFKNNEGWMYGEVSANDNYIKKTALLNNIKNKSYIEESVFEAVGNFERTNSLLSILSVDEVVLTISNGLSWLPSDIIIGYTYYGLGGSEVKIYDGGGTSRPRSYSQAEIYDGYDYRSLNCYNFLPAIVMKSDVKIEYNTECDSGKVQGSKDCPYKLSCSSC